MTILIFIITLSILVFVHELGHFQTARWFGVKVEEFGFGFPPRAIGKEKNGTIYSINWIPLGGFVRLKGEDGSDRDDPQSFASKKIWQRAIILCAGVFMNLVLCFVLMTVAFWNGAPQAVSPADLNNANIKSTSIQVSGLVGGSPAEKIGLKTGDKILAINEQTFKSADEIIQYTKDHQSAEKFIVKIDRQGEQKDFDIVLEKLAQTSSEQKSMGVYLIQTAVVRYGFFSGIAEGAKATYYLARDVLEALGKLIGSLFGWSEAVSAVAGPIGVAMMTGQAAELGFIYLLQFIAVLSLNLALLNIMPFPALDGGRLLFLIIEKIRRRPVNQTIEGIVHAIGFGLIMILVVVVTYGDLSHYGAGLFAMIKNWLPL